MVLAPKIGLLSRYSWFNITVTARELSNITQTNSTRVHCVCNNRKGSKDAEVNCKKGERGWFKTQGGISMLVAELKNLTLVQTACSNNLGKSH